MNKKIIIGIVIVIIALIAVFAFTQTNQTPVSTNGKLNTMFDFQTTVGSGETASTDFILRDMEGHAISNKNVTITYPIKKENKTFSATTNNEGKVHFDLKDLDKGNSEVTVKFNGDDKYNGCEGKQPHLGFTFGN